MWTEADLDFLTKSPHNATRVATITCPWQVCNSCSKEYHAYRPYDRLRFRGT